MGNDGDGGYTPGMRAIILGAGRGSRLRALTDEQPKPYAPIGGRRILDWLLAALRDAGVDDIVFVGGYRIEQVRGDYPQLTYRHNPDWTTTNILVVYPLWPQPMMEYDSGRQGC